VLDFPTAASAHLLHDGKRFDADLAGWTVTPTGLVASPPLTSADAQLVARSYFPIVGDAEAQAVAAHVWVALGRADTLATAWADIAALVAAAGGVFRGGR
jgi:hypothetical protein